ncbi:MAG: metallohydrolase [Acidobacteriota bacterium]|nr:metallohydrolase [Acidobacteriota bacterium]
MATSITFFPAGNGDMTLICLGDKAGTTILVDCNVRAAADDPKDKTRDIAKDLRERLKRDAKGRPYVDVFLLSHPDQDHCRGIQNHFHLGASSKYPDDKKADNEKRITINEVWSSPIVFRRTSAEHKLCDDALAFNKEAKRRVAVAREKDCTGVEVGDRILILGEDEGGKTDDILEIVVKLDADLTKVNGVESKVFKARLLAPLPTTKDDEEEMMRKNHSSVIMNMELADDETRKTVKNFLSGGDAEVLIWEKLWAKHKKAPAVLSYDLLQTPHHCSWHTLSNDSRSELGDEAKVSADAKAALSQIREGGRIVASSAAIEDNDCDPPSHAAKAEYQSITKGVKGEFLCTSEYPDATSPTPLELTVAGQKMDKSVRKASVEAPKPVSRGLIDDIRRGAAEAEAVSKGGNRRYA